MKNKKIKEMERVAKKHCDAMQGDECREYDSCQVCRFDALRKAGYRKEAEVRKETAREIIDYLKHVDRGGLAEIVERYFIEHGVEL